MHGCTGKLQHSAQGKQKPSDFPALLPCEAIPEHILALPACSCFPESASLAFPSLGMVLPAQPGGEVSRKHLASEQSSPHSNAGNEGSLSPAAHSQFLTLLSSVTAASPFIFGQPATALPSPGVTHCALGGLQEPALGPQQSRGRCPSPQEAYLGCVRVCWGKLSPWYKMTRGNKYSIYLELQIPGEGNQ